MPSILFHECVGYKFAKKHKKYDTNDFYLGIIIPDAVNAYGFASKEKRWKAHFRDESLEKWKDNVLNFYKINYNKYENNYLIGYLVHILTDILCDKIYRENLYPDLLKKGFDYESAYLYYEKGIKQFEKSNINEDWWEEVKRSFNIAKKIPINEIDEKMIEDWINYTLEKYQNFSYEEVGYINMDFVDKVIEKIEEIWENEKLLEK